MEEQLKVHRNFTFCGVVNRNESFRGSEIGLNCLRAVSIESYNSFINKNSYLLLSVKVVIKCIFLLKYCVLLTLLPLIYQILPK